MQQKKTERILSRSVSEQQGMSGAERLKFFFKLHTQVAKKQKCIDYVDVAGLIERGTSELVRHCDSLALWASTSEMSTVELMSSNVLSQLASAGRPFSASRPSASNSRRPSAAGAALTDAHLTAYGAMSTVASAWGALLSNA